MTITDTRFVRITTLRAGINHGFVAIIKARNGREIARGPVCPHRDGARILAEDIVAARGWRIA